MAADIRKYDLFKFIVTILLILLLALVYFEYPKGEGSDVAQAAAAESTTVDEKQSEKKSDLQLPDFPKTSMPLNFDAQQGMLIDSKGASRFSLNEAGDGWVPLIPEDISNQLPAGHALMQDESQVWIIQDSEGAALFSLNLADLTWQPIEAAETPVEAQAMQDIPDCPKANPARISRVGETVQVVNALIPLRSSPDANSNNILQPLAIGTILQITQLPVCMEYLEGANLWWGVQLIDGTSGWAAEGSAISPIYYLERIGQLE